MALIDALMAGQQFVAGIQQQQQAAREYRDRMAMLAREEERAMRQEGRAIAGDIRSAQFQDFQQRLMESEEERKQKRFESEEETSLIAQEQGRLAIEAEKLRIAELEREALNAPTEEARRTALYNLNRRILEVQAAEAEAGLAASKTASELTSKAQDIMGSIYGEIGSMATSPENITAGKFTEIRDEIVDLLEESPEASPYLGGAVAALQNLETTALTTASPAYKSLGDRLVSLRRAFGGPSLYSQELGWFKKQQMPSIADRWEMIKYAFTEPEQREKIEEGALQTQTLGQMLMMGNPMISNAFVQEQN